MTNQEIETAYRIAFEGFGYDLQGFHAVDTIDVVMGRMDKDAQEAFLALPYEECHAMARRVCSGYEHIIQD